MYEKLLLFHSLNRWLVLLMLLISIYNNYRGWKKKRSRSKIDLFIHSFCTATLHLQFVIGIVLYFISPITAYFIAHFPATIHLREIRFFGMEHLSVMTAAVILATLTSLQIKKEATDEQKFKKIFIRHTIVLLLIVSSIPWSFSPLTSRPNFR